MNQPETPSNPKYLSPLDITPFRTPTQTPRLCIPVSQAALEAFRAPTPQPLSSPSTVYTPEYSPLGSPILPSLPVPHSSPVKPLKTQEPLQSSSNSSPPHSLAPTPPTLSNTSTQESSIDMAAPPPAVMPTCGHPTTPKFNPEQP